MTYPTTYRYATILTLIRRAELRKLSILLVAWQVLDLATTALSISVGGTEANPLVNFLGWPLTLAGKALAVGALIMCAHKVRALLGMQTLRISVWLTALTVLWNVCVVGLAL